VSIFHVVRLLFTSCEEPVLISRLSLLQVDEEDKRLEAEVYDELEVEELNSLEVIYFNHPGVPTPFRRRGEQGAENESVQNDGDLSMGSRDLSQPHSSRSIFSRRLSLFSGERSTGSQSLGGGFALSTNDEP